MISRLGQCFSYLYYYVWLLFMTSDSMGAIVFLSPTLHQKHIKLARKIQTKYTWSTWKCISRAYKTHNDVNVKHNWLQHIKSAVYHQVCVIMEGGGQFGLGKSCDKVRRLAQLLLIGYSANQHYKQHWLLPFTRTMPWKIAPTCVKEYVNDLVLKQTTTWLCVYGNTSHFYILP